MLKLFNRLFRRREKLKLLFDWFFCEGCNRWHFRNAPCLTDSLKHEAVSYPCYWVEFGVESTGVLYPYLAWEAGLDIMAKIVAEREALKRSNYIYSGEGRHYENV